MDPILATAVALTVVALTLAAAEIMVTGFYLAPFAVGASVGAVSGYAGASPTVQAAVALVASFAAFLALRPFARRLNADSVHVPGFGENRLVGVEGRTLTDVGRDGGFARIDREEWRAESTVDISADTPVRVVSVRGTRVVVESIPEPSPTGDT